MESKRQKDPSCAERHSLELKQHLLHGGVNKSLSDEEATQRVRYWGGCPSTSTRARLWGTAGPSSGICRSDSAFRFCCFKVSKQFWGGQCLLGLVLRKTPLEREEAMLGHGAYHEWEQRQWSPITPDLTQRWRARGGVLPRNPLYFFWDWFLHMVRICFRTFWTSSSIWP